MKKELLNNTEPKAAFIPQNNDGTQIDGSIFDRTNVLSALIHGMAGAVTGTPTDLDVVFTLVHGDAVDDEATPTSITDAEDTTFILTLEAVQAGSAEDFINVDLTGVKKWVQVKAEATFTGGTAPKVDLASVITIGDPRRAEDLTDAQNI